MNEVITIKVYEIVGSSSCVAPDDGQKVHDQIVLALQNRRKVALSFANIQSLTSAFLNAAIGQLYGEFSEQDIRTYLSVIDMQPSDMALLKHVVDTAKRYFKDPERINASVHEVLGVEV